MFVTAEVVFVAAGTFGTNEIMMRSKAHGLPISKELGKGFSGNGDVSKKKTFILFSILLYNIFYPLVRVLNIITGSYDRFWDSPITAIAL